MMQSTHTATEQQDFMDNEMIRHSFLFEEHSWVARGDYFNVFGDRHPIEGMTVIEHEAGSWLVENTFFLTGGGNNNYRSNEYKNVYRVEPFSHQQDATNWRSVNSSMGKLEGHIVVMGETLLSVFRNLSGLTMGSETFVRVNDNHYQVKGALFEGDAKVSSWVLELTR